MPLYLHVTLYAAVTYAIIAAYWRAAYARWPSRNSNITAALAVTVWQSGGSALHYMSTGSSLGAISCLPLGGIALYVLGRAILRVRAGLPPYPRLILPFSDNIDRAS